MPPARITTTKKDEVPVETPDDTNELTLDQRVAYLEERNRLLEKAVLAPAADETDPDECIIVHRIPVFTEVNGMMTRSYREERVPLSQNAEYEKANGLC